MNWCCSHNQIPGLSEQIEMLHLCRKWERQKPILKGRFVFDKRRQHPLQFYLAKGQKRLCWNDGASPLRQLLGIILDCVD